MDRASGSRAIPAALQRGASQVGVGAADVTPPAKIPRKRKKQGENLAEAPGEEKKGKTKKSKEAKAEEEKRVDQYGKTVRFSPAPNQKVRERVQRALGIGVGAYGASQHRLFLIDAGEVTPKERGGPSQKFTVLGATGNVYDVTISKQPTCTCPDCQKGNVCKHILFIMLRVLKLGQNNPLVWQRALLTGEVEEVLNRGPAGNLDRAVLASAAVRRQWHQLTGKEGDEEVPPADAAEPSEEPSSRRKPLGGDDCPICYEEIEASGEELVWCSTCGTNIHKQCQQKWISSKNGQRVTCVYCRSPWVDGSAPSAPAGGPSTSQSHLHAGFTNLAQFSDAHCNADTSYEALYGERDAWRRRW